MKKVLLIVFCFVINSILYSQNPVLIGYWHNWNDSSTPYIPLNQIDSRYSVVCVSFAVPNSPSDMTMNFTPDGVSQSTFISQIQTLHNQGKKVLLSIGGANTSISLNNITNRDLFVNSMSLLLTTYGFDGIDIDIEHGNSILASGSIANPTSADVLNLIAAINQIKTNYYTTFSNNMMLTFAPETAYIHGGMSAFGGIWGGYLPLINAFRNDLSYVHVQLYNSGSMYGIDGNIYSQGNADFIVAMTEALIQGFSTAGGFFQGLPANKVALGLPACPSAAGGGFVSTINVENAIKYLRGLGPQPGTYILTNTAGYPNLGGMMTWSINWDKVATCNSTSYEYAQNFATIFGQSLSLNSNNSIQNKLILTPNPANDLIILNTKEIENYSVLNNLGQEIEKGTVIPNVPIAIEKLKSGIYFFKIDRQVLKFMKL